MSTARYLVGDVFDRMAQLEDGSVGLVLDPFGGSGTTGSVATGHGRDAVLIDLDSRNAELAAERIGMFLEVDYGSTEGAA